MIRILFPFTFRKPPVSTGVQMPRTLPPDSDDSLTSMAKGVNDVLNFYTSRILERKIRILRSGILCFLAGVLTALPHHLINA